jgi:hypothetical protein
MERLFVAILGLLMVLSFLAPAALSQETPNAGYGTYAGYSVMGTPTQSGSQSSSISPYTGIGGQLGNTTMDQSNSVYGSWMNYVDPYPLAKVSGETSGQTIPGASGPRCVGVAGGMSC